MSQTPEEVLGAWRESAPYWEKHAFAIRTMFEPLTRALIEEAEITEGQTVLDVAGGIGEPSLTIAEVVGPHGSVTCTDAIAGMVEAARREARRRGITNIGFRQCTADSLPFENNSFDRVVSRLGVMFFPYPLTALIEMLRVAKNEGRLTLVVWAASKLHPYFDLISTALSRYIEPAPEEADAPGAFRFAEPGALAALLRKAGAAEIKEKLFRFQLEAPLSIEEYWSVRTETSDTLREKLSRLSPEQLRLVKQEVMRAAGQFFPDGRMSFPAQAIIVSGNKAP